MKLFHHHTARHHHRTLDSDFWLFELSVWMHTFARALIAIFIPILLLQLDYSVSDVMLYYFLYCLFDVPLNFLADSVVRRIGARAAITAGTLAAIAFFIILFALTPNNWPLIVALALAAAIYDTLYWVAHLYFFMESSKNRKSASKDTGLMSIARRLAGLLAPAFGALVLIFFSDKVLIPISILILLLSIVPLLKAKHVKDKPTKPKPTFKEFFPEWRNLRDYVITSLYGVHAAAEGIIWPMFIFLTFESIESVAIIPIIVSITAMIFTFFVGKLKRSHFKESIAIASTLIAVAWVLRFFFAVPTFYFVSVFLVGLFMVFISIPVDSSIYERGENVDSLTSSTYHNFFAMISKLIFFGVLALVSHIFPSTFWIAASCMILVALIAGFAHPVLPQTIKK